ARRRATPSGRRLGRRRVDVRPVAGGNAEDPARRGVSREIIMSFFVDTDICSAYLKQNRFVFNPFLQYAGQLHLSVINLGELYTWAKRRQAPPRRLQKLLKLLHEVTLLEVDHDVADKFGEVRAYLLDHGQPMPIPDLWIAATALVYG